MGWFKNLTGAITDSDSKLSQDVGGVAGAYSDWTGGDVPATSSGGASTDDDTTEMLMLAGGVVVLAAAVYFIAKK